LSRSTSCLVGGRAGIAAILARCVLRPELDHGADWTMTPVRCVTSIVDSVFMAPQAPLTGFRCRQQVQLPQDRYRDGTSTAPIFDLITRRIGATGSVPQDQYHRCLF
jgi:hypothetical protein